MKKKHYRHKTHSTNYSVVSSLISPGDSASFLDTTDNEVLECEDSSDETCKFQEILMTYLQLNKRNHQINTRVIEVLSKENKVIKEREKARLKEAYYKQLSLLYMKNKLIHEQSLMLENADKNRCADRRELRDLIEKYNMTKAEYNKKLDLFHRINQKQEISKIIQNRRNLLIVEKKKILAKQEKIGRKRKKIKVIIEKLYIRLNKTGEINEIPLKYLQASLGYFSELDTTCEKSSLVVPFYQRIDNLNNQIKDLQKIFNDKSAANHQKHLIIQKITQNLKKHQKRQETLNNSQKTLKFSINSLKSKLKSSEDLLETKEVQLKAKQKYLKALESDLYDRFSILLHTFS